MYILKKEEDYLALLYKENIAGLYNYGTGLGFSHDLCLDAIHDVFYKLLINNPVIHSNSPKYYLFRSFRNQLIDLQKSRKNEVSRDNMNDLPFHVDVTVADTIIEEEEQQRIKKKVELLLGILTHRQREAVYLRYMEGMEYDRIGELLSMNAESVRKLVFRGIEKLRQQSGNIPLLLFLPLLYTAS